LISGVATSSSYSPAQLNVAPLRQATGTVQVPVEVKIWLDFPPPGAPVSVVNPGAEGSVKLPPGFTTGLVELLQFPASVLVPGAYGFNCRMLNPVTETWASARGSLSVSALEEETLAPA